MAITLQLDQTVDGVPPGSQATQFGSGQMMDNVNNYLQQQAGNIGVEAAQNQVMQSFVKGLGLESDPKALSLTVQTFGMGQLSNELGQPNVSSAGIAAAQAQNIDKGTTV